jgi:hypothetical protein
MSRVLRAIRRRLQQEEEKPASVTPPIREHKIELSKEIRELMNKPEELNKSIGINPEMAQKEEITVKEAPAPSSPPAIPPAIIPTSPRLPPGATPIGSIVPVEKPITATTPVPEPVSEIPEPEKTVAPSPEEKKPEEKKEKKPAKRTISKRSKPAKTPSPSSPSDLDKPASITNPMPLSSLLQEESSDRIAAAKQEIASLPKPTKEATKSGVTGHKQQVQYIDPTVFNRALLQRADLQLISETLVDGNFWTYKTVQNKTGYSVPSIQQFMSRMKKAVKGFIVQDAETGEAPRVSHAVKFALPSTLLEIVRNVIASEQSNFKPLRDRRRGITKSPQTKGTDEEDKLFKETEDKVNNDESINTDIGEDDEQTMSGESGSSPTRLDDYKASAILKIIGDMPPEELRRAVNSWRLRHDREPSLTDILATAATRPQQQQQSGLGMGEMLKNTITEALQTKLYLSIIAPIVSAMDSGNKGANGEMDIEHLLRILELLGIKTKGDGDSDIDKLLKTQKLITSMNEPGQKGSEVVEKAIQDLRMTFMDALKSKTDQDTTVQTLTKKIDELARDRADQAKDEKFEAEIDSVKGMIADAFGKDKGKEPGAFELWTGLQTEIEKIRGQYNKDIEVLKKELDKEKTESLRDTIRNMGEQFNEKIEQIRTVQNTSNQSQNPNLLAQLEGSVIDLVKTQLGRVAKATETPEDIENKRLNSLDRVITPIVATVKDSLLTPLGQGIGKGLEEQMKRAAANPPPPIQPAPSLNQSVTPVPPQRGAPPPANQPKPPVYYMPGAPEETAENPFVLKPPATPAVPETPADKKKPQLSVF